MEDESGIYEKIRCPKCEHRLNKPMVLKCQHLVCQSCLESKIEKIVRRKISMEIDLFVVILRNHRSNACCPACKKPLDEYQIENYSFLLPKHYVTKLLASFMDVNQCETCKTFTNVEACSQCQQDQCESCQNQHEAKHFQTSRQSSQTVDQLSSEELEILQAIRKDLTEQEFDDLLRIAKLHLNDALSQGTGSPTSNDGMSKGNPTDGSTLKKESNCFWPETAEAYDWSKHQKITADDILNNRPERVKELLRLNFLPRPYQIRMIQPGLKRRNTLICLQTGAGKTFV